YFHWMENTQDWCISRQLWWGHRIPVYYCEDCGEMVVSKTPVDTCPKCGSKHMTQDPDTLDTWFSSALWPFSTLGWPLDTEELKYFYPTDTLVTGYDIIFFWVVRMMFSGIHNMGDVPFHTVFIHGLIRDEQGRKMSKSLGNGVDPIEVIDKYGADALRFFLATGNSPGNDMRYSETRVESCRNFANKLYNASRFVLMNIEGHDIPLTLPETLKLEDKWILSTLNTLCKDVTDNLEKFELGIAVQKLYDFIWDCFCDWYIELKKTDLYSDDETAAQNARQVLVYVLDKILKLLHPFMPFITEEIWQNIPHEGETIMREQYPEYTEALNFSEQAADMQKIMTAITAIRTQRNEMNVPPSKKAKLYIATKTLDTFRHGVEFFRKLASANEVEIGTDFEIDGAVTVVTEAAKLYIPMNELVDMEAERKRLNKELEQTEKMLKQDEGKLSNPGFMGKAPAAVIEKIKNQAEREREKIALIKAAIENLK
ncbi:MAG: class I tRNA ligase family protein, partial [Ruminococcus sp.]|nr:class I tRNA ligase family protein [Ruminococcus sp.]